MKLDTGLGTGLEGAGAAARAAEEAGYDGVWSAETAHDPFLPLAVAAEHTERVQLGTSIAVAFPRSPLTLAHIGHDLQAFSKGRTIVGLGSQIQPHIEKRYSATWSRPAARMRELILAMRAIWACWDQGTKLDFRGEFYRHTLMTPFFTPDRQPYGLPKVFLAAVGPRMTAVAGEVADGFLAHGFTTPKYLRETTLPTLEAALAKSGRSRADFEVTLPFFLVTGTTEEEMDKSRTAVKRRIAFYGSTPAYRGVLEAHGWGDLQDDLNAMSKRGQWTEMGELIDDEMLDAFAVVAEPEGIAGAVKERYAGVADRVSLTLPVRRDPERWAAVLAEVKAA